jgi:hypothetical protein
MTQCNRAPAIKNAAGYVEGTLTVSEAEQFEDHYWNCPACLAYLQAIEAVGDELAREPVPQIAPVPRKPLFAWPVLVWTLGPVAAAAVITVMSFRMLSPHPALPSQALNNPANSGQPSASPQTVRSSPAQQAATQLADLSLPAFVMPTLRGASMEAHFKQGMTAYGQGNCRDSLAALAQVPVEDKQERKAHLYSGLCLMHERELAAAASSLHKVVDAGDSQQLELALYYLAQIQLDRNDLAGAHRFLVRTISLQGDMEQRARLQDQKVLALIDKERDGGTGHTGSK